MGKVIDYSDHGEWYAVFNHCCTCGSGWAGANNYCPDCGEKLLYDDLHVWDELEEKEIKA